MAQYLTGPPLNYVIEPYATLIVAMSKPLVGLDLPEIQQALGPGQPAFRGRQIYRALYQQKVEDLEKITTLPADLREPARARVYLGLPRADSWFDSSDGTRRYLLGSKTGVRSRRC